MVGLPATLDFTPDVAGDVADAAEDAACPKPAPSYSPARTGRFVRGVGAAGYAARPHRRVFCKCGTATWPVRWTQLSAQQAAKKAKREMFFASLELTGARNKLRPRPRPAPSLLQIYSAVGTKGQRASSREC